MIRGALTCRSWWKSMEAGRSLPVPQLIPETSAALKFPMLSDEDLSKRPRGFLPQMHSALLTYTAVDSEINVLRVFEGL